MHVYACIVHGRTDQQSTRAAMQSPSLRPQRVSVRLAYNCSIMSGEFSRENLTQANFHAAHRALVPLRTRTCYSTRNAVLGYTCPQYLVVAFTLITPRLTKPPLRLLPMNTGPSRTTARLHDDPTKRATPVLQESRYRTIGNVAHGLLSPDIGCTVRILRSQPRGRLTHGAPRLLRLPRGIPAAHALALPSRLSGNR
jgi:hypothetical protein